MSLFVFKLSGEKSAGPDVTKKISVIKLGCGEAKRLNIREAPRDFSDTFSFQVVKPEDRML